MTLHGSLYRVALLITLVSFVPLGASAAEAGSDRPEFLNSPEALKQDWPFSEAVRAGDFVFLSGQIGTDANGRVVPGGIRAEARQTLENIKTVLERNGLGLEDVVKCTVFLADIAEWPVFNEIYREFFERPYPARSAFAASGLALNARLELECIAYAPRRSHTQH
jgi:reactive intermediate/imine deaminase